MQVITIKEEIMEDKVLDVRSKEATEDIANRLYKMLESVDDEVNDRILIFGEYLALCCARFAQRHLLIELLPPGLVTDLDNTALRLCYFLAKKPHELEAQLNELKATYGTVNLDEMV